MELELYEGREEATYEAFGCGGSGGGSEGLRGRSSMPVDLLHQAGRIRALELQNREKVSTKRAVPKRDQQLDLTSSILFPPFRNTKVGMARTPYA